MYQKNPGQTDRDPFYLYPKFLSSLQTTQPRSIFGKIEVKKETKIIHRKSHCVLFLLVYVVQHVLQM